MALEEGQFQIRDLLMGEGTPYQIVTGTNPFNRTVRADQSGPRAWNHGSWSGVEWSGEAVVPLYVYIDVADLATWMPLHQQLTAAFRPVGEELAEVPFRFAMGGREYVMFGRPRMVEPDLELVALGRTVTQCAFVALDPFIHAGAETVVGPMGLPTFTGGLTVPFTAPLTIDGQLASGFTDLVNEGTAATGLLLRLDGPLPEPRVVLQRADGITQTLRFDLELADGQWLDIDTAARTVLLNGTTPRRGRAAGDWPTLPPGQSTLRWSAGDFNDQAALTARFRSAWW